MADDANTPTDDSTAGTDISQLARKPFQSRRGFLAGSAALGGGAFALSATGAGAAQESDGTASVTFDDQTANGMTVTVQSVTLPEGGFVAIHDQRLTEGKPLESVIGVSSDLDAGMHESVQVTLFDVPGGDFETAMLTEDQPLIAMPHLDSNDNNSYDFVQSGGEADGPYTADGNAVTDKAMITTEGDSVTDVEVLNYALTLEHLEHTFYHQGMEDFSAEEFVNADVACNVCPELRQMIPEHIKVVGEHEHAHVETLTQTIQDIGGDPVEAAEYDFGYSTPSEFLELAMVFENTGVAAYAGAAPSIKEDAYLSAALSIHSVEARHAAMFNVVNGKSPFPTAFDEPKSMETVKDAVAPFIVSN